MNQIPIIAQRSKAVNGLTQTITSNIKRLKQSTSSSNHDPQAFLVTTHLKEKPIAAKNSVSANLEYATQNTNRLYNLILNNTVARHTYKSRKKYHPFMMSFIDFSGTREHQANFTQLPHVHSVLVLHPETQSRFQELCDKNFRLNEASKNTQNIRKIDAIEIEQADNAFQKVIDYSAKSYFLNFIPFVAKEEQANMMMLHG